MSEGGGGKGPKEPGEAEEGRSSDEFLRNVARVAPQAPPSARGSLVGARVDHFLVRALLGAGGMGVVYEAEDEHLGRVVALKVLPPDVDAEARHRFVREARAASRIVHANVATIYEAGESAEGAYIAMECVRGETLRDWLRAPRTTAARTRVVREIASALAEAHAMGIVHRDLKPDNVMITPAEAVKVLDFGLAKQSSGAAPGLDETATADGRILGTPSYMSPEQAKGMRVDARSDVFSFGVLLYEVFTGERPFKGDNVMSILIAIDRDEPIAPSKVRADVPVAIERIIRRALAKTPGDRYADGGELLGALQALETSLAGPRFRPLRSRWFIAMVAIAALVEVVFVTAALRSNRPPPSPEAAPELAAGKALTEFPPYGSKNEEAREEYRRGLQYVRSGIAGSRDVFDRATAIDPGFAEAHLRAALSRVDSEDFSIARPQFHEANLRRAALAPRDQALLDAFEPVIERNPADLHESAERIRAAAARFPGDAEIAYYAGRASSYDAPERAPPFYERALALDPGFARVLFRLAEVHFAAGRDAEGDAAIDRCLAVAPNSVICMDRRTDLDGQRGACAQMESDARRMLTVTPNLMSARAFLASALVGQGRSVVAVREVIDQGLGLAQDGGDPGSFFDAMLMESEADLLEGNLEAALGRFRALEPLVAPMADEDSHANVAANEVILLAEMGRDPEAQAIARDFLARHDAWEPNPGATSAVVSDYVVALATYLARAGLFSKRDVDAVRSTEVDRWLKRAQTGEERGLVWAMAYATPAETPAEGEEALAALPAFGSLPPVSRRTLVNAFVGHALLVAGRVDDALPRLERTTGACDLILNAWPHLRAYYDLGQAREAKGDRAGACAAYGAVLARWGSAKPRSLTGGRALARSKALGCGR